MEYSLPYICILLFFCLLAFLYENYKEKSVRQNISLIAISAFFIFFGFRGYAYSDWIAYSEFLKNVEWSDVLVISSKYKAVVHEPGFSLLCCLCKSIINEYAFLVFVITSLDLYLFLRFLRKWDIDNISFVFALFVCFMGVDIMFNLIRNQISIFIFLNALEYIDKRKPLHYFSLCVLALCFHLSSIIFFPLYFFLHRKVNKYVFLGTYFVCLVLMVIRASFIAFGIDILSMGGILGEKAEFYTEYLSTARELGPTILVEQLSLVLLVFCYYDKLTSGFHGSKILINSLILYFIFFYVFGMFRDLSSRLSTLFVFSYWILWFYLLRVICIFSNKILYYTLICLYCIYKTAFAFPTPIQKYDNLLFGAQTQEERMKILNSTFDFD